MMRVLYRQESQASAERCATGDPADAAVLMCQHLVYDRFLDCAPTTCGFSVQLFAAAVFAGPLLPGQAFERNC